MKKGTFDQHVVRELYRIDPDIEEDNPDYIPMYIQCINNLKRVGRIIKNIISLSYSLLKYIIRGE